MVRRTPTYNEISALSRDLQENNAIKKTRAAAEALVVKLGDEQVRRRLAREATPEDLEPGESVQAIRRRALAQIWRLVISRAIAAVENIVEGKKKLLDSDVKLPYKLLLLSDKTDELFDKDTPKLSRQETKLVLNYCLNMLYDDKVMGTEGAEDTLLETLAYICGRREHVAYFRPDQQVQAILEEVEKRLIVGEDEDELPVGKETAKTCSDIFRNLLSTLDEIGIGLHLLLPQTLKMLAKWCHQNKRREDDIVELPGMIGGGAILLRSCPDLAVAPLTRYGRNILTFVRKRLNRGKAPSVMHDKALVDYLLQHL